MQPFQSPDWPTSVDPPSDRPFLLLPLLLCPIPLSFSYIKDLEAQSKELTSIKRISGLETDPSKFGTYYHQLVEQVKSLKMENNLLKDHVLKHLGQLPDGVNPIEGEQDQSQNQHQHQGEEDGEDDDGNGSEGSKGKRKAKGK